MSICVYIMCVPCRCFSVLIQDSRDIYIDATAVDYYPPVVNFMAGPNYWQCSKSHMNIVLYTLCLSTLCNAVTPVLHNIHSSTDNHFHRAHLICYPGTSAFILLISNFNLYWCHFPEKLIHM